MCETTNEGEHEKTMSTRRSTTGGVHAIHVAVGKEGGCSNAGGVGDDGVQRQGQWCGEERLPHLSTLETLELEVYARDLIKIKSGHVTVLGLKSIRIATRNSGVRASTKKLDISPSLYSEVPSP